MGLAQTRFASNGCLSRDELDHTERFVFHFNRGESSGSNVANCVSGDVGAQDVSVHGVAPSH